MAEMTRALTVEEIQGTATIIKPELNATPVLKYSDELARLGFRLITGIQWKHAIQNINRQGANARRYHEGMDKNGKAGIAEKRELEVSIVTSFYTDNIANYQSVTLDGSDGRDVNPNYKWPAAESMLKAMVATHSEDIGDNIVHGAKANGEDSPLGLFDGLTAQIARDITNGKISKGAGNLIDIDPIAAPASSTDTKAYDAFIAAYTQLNPALQNAPVVKCLCSKDTETYIRQAMANKFGASAMLMRTDLNAGPAIIGAPNVQLEASYLAGKGDRLMFYLPDGVDFGVNDLASEAYVRVSPDPKDANIVYTQVQSKVGIRINNVSPRVFAVTEGDWNPVQTSGDFAEASIVAVAKPAASGSVTIKNAAGEEVSVIRRGETVTLEASPASSKTFTKWTDNDATTATRTVVGTGLPMVFEANFSA